MANVIDHSLGISQPRLSPKIFAPEKMNMDRGAMDKKNDFDDDFPPDFRPSNCSRTSWDVGSRSGEMEANYGGGLSFHQMRLFLKFLHKNPTQNKLALIEGFMVNYRGHEISKPEGALINQLAVWEEEFDVDNSDDGHWKVKSELLAQYSLDSEGKDSPGYIPPPKQASAEEQRKLRQQKALDELVQSDEDDEEKIITDTAPKKPAFQPRLLKDEFPMANTNQVESQTLPTSQGSGLNKTQLRSDTIPRVGQTRISDPNARLNSNILETMDQRAPPTPLERALSKRDEGEQLVGQLFGDIASHKIDPSWNITLSDNCNEMEHRRNDMIAGSNSFAIRGGYGNRRGSGSKLPLLGSSTRSDFDDVTNPLENPTLDGLETIALGGDEDPAKRREQARANREGSNSLMKPKTAELYVTDPNEVFEFGDQVLVQYQYSRRRLKWLGGKVVNVQEDGTFDVEFYEFGKGRAIDPRTRGVKKITNVAPNFTQKRDYGQDVGYWQEQELYFQSIKKTGEIEFAQMGPDPTVIICHWFGCGYEGRTLVEREYNSFWDWFADDDIQPWMQLIQVLFCLPCVCIQWTPCFFSIRHECPECGQKVGEYHGEYSCL
mmetsp:Transcript_21202/g.27532  ORF Transcript_21202/g.27532 Transcript_21202/m.27532 type:complete len:604 (-) Transcript_21202:231-2042(-)